MNSYVYGTQPAILPRPSLRTWRFRSQRLIMSICSGATLTVPGASSVMARVVADASSDARSPSARTGISHYVLVPHTRDTRRHGIGDRPIACRISIHRPLAGGSQGRLQYHGTLVFDQSQDALLIAVTSSMRRIPYGGCRRFSPPCCLVILS